MNYQERIKEWKKREEIALQHTEEQENKHHEEITRCIEETECIAYIPHDIPKGTHATQIVMLQTTSTMAIDYDGLDCKNRKTALLNFASYHKPGGGYIRGAKAQEEDICADSFLYNVLSSSKCRKAFYNRHREDTHGLYGSDLLYSPNVLFLDKMYCDVITCAAVNHLSSDPAGISTETCLETMKERCRAVLQVAAENGVETLILGAFGCGVFRNEPEDIANIFKELLTGEFSGVFYTVIFPIPDKKNYEVFKV